MAIEMIWFVGMLQYYLNLGELRAFMPFFELVGSMAEGTRVGLANELDLALKFRLWMDQTPFRVYGDPFSLKKNFATLPACVDKFFLGNVFQYHMFMRFILDAVEIAIGLIFQSENHPKLKCVTTNKEWNEGRSPCNGQCKENLQCNGFEQCEKCAVTVSQTKSGVALQFEFEDHVTGNGNIYCSIDLIPIFAIEPIPTMELARLINDAMLGDNPPEGWLNFMFKYFKDYKIIQELAESGSGKIISVGLKTMNFYEGRNHHIKHAQEMTESKFSSRRMKDIYSYVKLLKKVLHLDLSSYWVKKELMKPEYESILDSCTESKDEWSDADDFALVQILMQSEFKTKVGDKIDFQESLNYGFICLKSYTSN